MEREQTRQQFFHSAIDRVIGIIRKAITVSAGRVFGAIRKTTPKGLFIVLIFALMFLVLWETVRDRDVSFVPILVPEELANIGYPPRVVAQRVIDRMNVVYGESIKLINDPETITDKNNVGT